MPNTTTSTHIPPADRVVYNKVLLKRAIPSLVHDRFGQSYPVNLHSGDQPRWRRYNSLTSPTAPLVEGVTPSAQQLSKTDVDGQLIQYGTYVEIADYIQFTTNDGKKLLTETSELLGEAMGDAKDKITRDTLAAGTSVYYANGVAGRTSIISKLAATDLLKIIRALQNANAKPFTKQMIQGTNKIGTVPIAPAYFAIVDPYTRLELKSILGSSFVEPHQYPDPSKAYADEVGSYDMLRFVMSTNAKVFADGGGSCTAASLKYTTASSACDVHTMLIFGENAYGMTPLTGHSAEIISKPLGSGNDPLNQRSTVGCKFCTDTVILNEAFMYRYEFGVSA